MRRLGRRGVTLVELVIGLAIASTLALVVAGLFRGALAAYQESSRQLSAVTRFKQAASRNGRLRGLAWGAAASASVASLASAELELNVPGEAALRYRVQDSRLLQSQAGSQFTQAEGVRQIEVGYYNMTPAGLVASTDPAAASLVFVRVRLPGCGKADCVYVAGGALRNRP